MTLVPTSWLLVYLLGAVSIGMIWRALTPGTARARKHGLIATLLWPAAFLLLFWVALIAALDAAVQRPADDVFGREDWR